MQVAIPARSAPTKQPRGRMTRPWVASGEAQFVIPAKAGIEEDATRRRRIADAMKSSSPDSDVAFWMPAFAGMTRGLVVFPRGDRPRAGAELATTAPFPHATAPPPLTPQPPTHGPSASCPRRN